MKKLKTEMSGLSTKTVNHSSVLPESNSDSLSRTSLTLQNARNNPDLSTFLQENGSGWPSVRTVDKKNEFVKK